MSTVTYHGPQHIETTFKNARAPKLADNHKTNTFLYRESTEFKVHYNGIICYENINAVY